MIDADSLAAIAQAIEGCRRCSLWRGATQGVAGEGVANSALMLVGEQPGDQEDLAGRPFVGPAGQVLDRALLASGIDRDRAWVTNAVKHFKHERRGKRRLHKTSDAGEVAACRWWLDQERRLIGPKVIVAMGGTAALAVFGRAAPVMKSRLRSLPLADGTLGVISVHPSYVLRVPAGEARERAFADFVTDLRFAADLLQP